MGYYLGIDLGTSYFKAGLFDENGCLKGLGRCSVQKNVENDITCELPVDIFWNTLRGCIQEAISEAKTTSGKILSISYSSQANSFVLLDRSYKPLTPLILWPDKRAEKLGFPADLISRKAEFHEITGLGVEPGFQFAFAKIRWFQEEQPQIWEQVGSVMTISDYLTFKLTGQRVTDYSTASMTGLFNVAKCEWWSEMLQIFNLEAGQLSVPVRTGTPVGQLTFEGAECLGFKEGMPLLQVDWIIMATL